MKRLLVLTIVVLLWLSSCPFTVDQAEYVYVTQFGRPVATLDGGTNAGLHVKLPWPIQTVQRLDRRVQMFDLPPAELLTHDPRGQTIDRTLTVKALVCWRIAGRDGAGRFLSTVGTPEQARAVLGQRVSGRLGAVLGTPPSRPTACATRLTPWTPSSTLSCKRSRRISASSARRATCCCSPPATSCSTCS